MARRLRFPPRMYPLVSDGSSYVVVKHEAGYFDVAYYRPYRVGEDGITDPEDAKRMHRRFAIRKRKLIDALRVVFCEDVHCDWDADVVDLMIRQKQRAPVYPGTPSLQEAADLVHAEASDGG